MKLHQLIFTTILLITAGMSQASTLQKQVKFDPSWCKYYCMKEADKDCGANEKCFRSVYKSCMAISAAEGRCTR
ncbi:hypothetical protein [Xenorhabdus thuongxuanensis]|uniref:Uncharacterized protein n=1 Tax=Xenorhabdus thuongxuanensis TaxID=1873484 RepID=A0A1Q5TZ73_9GAMM|nr:hypothetical protein [Xenorhabdus thuongxuanensis]OKP05524.1 hypothetical protein Xentx_02442 [Xenorhabdus thuongxuanensis]